MFFYLSFIIAAALGASFRLQISQWILTPWGTLSVNFLGSLLIGLLAFGMRDSSLKSVLMIAFLGSLTTYSSFSLDLVKLIQGGETVRALSYFLLTNIFCVGGCLVGARVGVLFQQPQGL